jgi:hypothetical protein
VVRGRALSEDVLTSLADTVDVAREAARSAVSELSQFFTANPVKTREQSLHILVGSEIA